MPTYDYQCRSCGAVTEVIHSMAEDGPATCEACGGDLRRVLYPTGIIFKGSGFYRTDSRAAREDSSPRTPAATSGADGSAKVDTGPKADGAGKRTGGAPASESPAKSVSSPES